ncbi:STAS domain protein [Ostertagia ostertagi]
MFFRPSVIGREQKAAYGYSERKRSEAEDGQTYKWKEYFHGDLIAGLTVGIMHVPQGKARMAYASLAGVPPVYGMYSSFFASTVYMFFGTARHVSIGQNILLFGVLRLGFLTTYLSDPLVSGFTTGSAAHVMVSQLNKVIGVKLPRHEGTGMLLLMVRDLIYSIPSTNLIALLISVVGILFLDLGRTYISPRVKRISPVPPPLELILVIIGVILSMTLSQRELRYSIVNTIPRGFPIAIATEHHSGALFDLRCRRYCCNLLYVCDVNGKAVCKKAQFPVGASLSRSSVCEMSGANTQLYTLFSSTLLLTVILSLGPFLEPLPMCILACIVIVSLKSLFLQVKEPRFTAAQLDTIPPQHVPEGVTVLKFESPLHFANVTLFTDKISELITSVKEDSLLNGRAIVVDCTAMAYVDSMGLDALREVYNDAKKSDVALQFCGLNDTILDIIKKDDILRAFHSRVGSASLRQRSPSLSSCPAKCIKERTHGNPQILNEIKFIIHSFCTYHCWLCRIAL